MSSPEQPAPSPPPPAGWYPDPDAPRAQQRYWDGAAWTDQRAPYASPPAGSWLVGAGYLLSVTVIFGFVIGVWLAVRRDRNAPWVLALTVFFLALWIVLGILGNSDCRRRPRRRGLGESRWRSTSRPTRGYWTVSSPSIP